MGNVAPAALICCAAPTDTVEISTQPNVRNFDFIRSPQIFALECYSSVTEGSPLFFYRRRRRTARQRVAEVEVNSVVVRRLRRVQGHEPGIAHQVLVLAHEVERAVLRVFPEGLVEAEADF